MVPVDLITGFLGAGKTTFLQKYTDYLARQGIRFAVVENEFGAAGVDTAALQASGQPPAVYELTGGCICCTLKQSFHEMLSGLAGRYARILVEPSGLFNLDDFNEVMYVLEHDGICCPGLCLTVVDPHTLPGLDADARRTLYGELCTTGAVLWSKLDVPPKTDLQAAAQAVRAIAGDPELPIWPVPSHALTDADFAALMQVRPAGRVHDRLVINHRMLFDSVMLHPRGRYTEAGLRAAFGRITSDPACGEILRAKGFLSGPDGMFWQVNYTLGALGLAPSPAARPMLNWIGHGLDRARIKAYLEDAVEAPDKI